MRHQQILDQLAAPAHVRALTEDLTRWVGMWLLTDPGQPVPTEPVLTRWRCLLDDPGAATATKHKVWIALATLLHKYGVSDPAVTARALIAVDELNRDVVLSDAFARRSPDIKAFLQSPPAPLTRRPNRPKSLTLLRPGDVLSVQLGPHFHGAFVRDVTDGGTRPVLEFYSGRFDRPPATADLAGRPAARERGRARFGVAGLVHLPDPARQFVALPAPLPEPPAGGEPGSHDGLYTITDTIRLQQYLTTVFDATDRR